MTRVNRAGSIVVALVALGIIVMGGREVKASVGISDISMSQAGIIQVGGGGNGSDPAYTYEFNVNLTGTIEPFSFLNPLGTLTSFTVDGLVGVYPFDPTGTEPTGWSYIITVAGLPHAGFPYFTSNVTWFYTGSTAIGPDNGQSVGIFEITTAGNLPAGYPPSVIPPTISYSSSLDGGSPNGGIVPLVELPEPSTAIAPLMVLLGLLVKRKLRVLRGRKAG
jgi:hypothetical protein